MVLVVSWALLTSVTQGVPHRPHSAAALECLAVVREFARRYSRSGCAKVLPYRLNVKELVSDCLRGDEEGRRVVISKIKHVGDLADVFRRPAGTGTCLPWVDDFDGGDPAAPAPPSHTRPPDAYVAE